MRLLARWLFHSGLFSKSVGKAQAKQVSQEASHNGYLVRRADAFPDLLQLHSARPARYPFLLESVAHGTPQANYDVLFAFPEDCLRLDAAGRLRAGSWEPRGSDFLDNLDAWWTSAFRAVPNSHGLPFHGGWFVYLGYELVGQIEPVLALPKDKREFPVAAAYRVPAAVIRDHRRRDTVLVTEADRPELMDALEADLRYAAARIVSNEPVVDGKIQEDPPGQFLDRVGKIKRYIRDGDVFQVNLSRSWHARLKPDVNNSTLYQRLRVHNPAPFAGLAVLGDAAVMSSSPERLATVRDGWVSTRPIAGTHPRDVSSETDRALSSALLGHPKERAEHIMLIDLERNDLGRVCVSGSVNVSELMVLESYAHVHHIVSNVEGKLIPDASPGKILRAVFPGGTITGCPKVRCMEIIAELEELARGPYTGAMGYLNRDGSADFNILIRIIERLNDQVRVRAGAGIVADSIPERELHETKHKARGPLHALTGESSVITDKRDL